MSAMDLPRLSTAPSIHLDGHHEYNRRLPGQQYPSIGPMRIPNKTIEDFAPPPLPPPPRINGLEDGHDAGWLHANGMGTPDVAKLAPINPSSSLYGGHRRPEPIPRLERMTLDEDDGRESSGFPNRPSRPQVRIEPPTHVEDGFRNAISTKPVESILQGELDFSRKSVKHSSDNYDRHLLSKIGKPNSPPRPSTSLGSDSRGSIATLPFHPRSSAGGVQSSLNWGRTLTKEDARSLAMSSAAVSPHPTSGWTEYSGYRSPSVESNAPSSVDIDAYPRDNGRRQMGSVTPQSEDSFMLASRSNKNSSDQGIFSDVESEPTGDESGHFRQLPSERTTSVPDHARYHGMKRRASSPPREPVSNDRHALHKATSNGDLSQRRTTGSRFTSIPSPGARFATSHASLSSLSSGSYRTSASLGSSAALSLAGSSMTSVSSYDRISTGALSPSSESDHLNEKALLNHHSPGESLSGISGTTYCRTTESKPALSRRKVSLDTTLNGKSSTSKIGGLYICDCCPKKPKKFDTQDDLRAHESEKQYSCQYCNNRFKNKNEAERHQNSLHLRRHSWSCAALASYQAAFHPSTSPAGQPNAGPAHDTCGYCGEEFTNFPHPDWDQRFEHLTTKHKFGECNNVKKFFRADHFRQHLKHSHGGTSGKWTNILENACMKEEPHVEARLGSISEQEGRRSEIANGSGADSAGFASETIDEVMDET